MKCTRTLTCSTSDCRRGYLTKSSGCASIHRPISLKTLSCSDGMNEMGVVLAFGDDELDLSSADQSNRFSGSGWASLCRKRRTNTRGWTNDLYIVRKKLMICSFVAFGVIFSVDGERGPTVRLNPPQRWDSFPVNISTHFSIVAPLHSKENR